MQALGAVHVDTGFLLDGRNGGVLPAAGAGQGDHLVHGQAVEQFVPLGIVVGQAHQILTVGGDGGVAGDRHGQGGVVLGDLGAPVGVQDGGHHLIAGGGGALQVGNREGAGKVGAGHVVVGAVAAVTGGHIVKLVHRGHLIGGAGVGFVVHFAGQFKALAQHAAVLGGPAMGTVGAQFAVEGVAARVQHIAALVLVVVGGQLVLVHGDGHGLAGARLQGGGLVVAYQNHLRLFHAACGVGLLTVQLHNRLGSHAAGVGHLHREGQGAGGLVVGGLAVPFLAEGGVGDVPDDAVLIHGDHHVHTPVLHRFHGGCAVHAGGFKFHGMVKPHAAGVIASFDLCRAAAAERQRAQQQHRQQQSRALFHDLHNVPPYMSGVCRRSSLLCHDTKNRPPRTRKRPPTAAVVPHKFHTPEQTAGKTEQTVSPFLQKISPVLSKTGDIIQKV